MRFVSLKWNKLDEWTPVIFLADNGKNAKSGLVSMPLWDSHLEIIIGEKFCSGYSRGAYHYTCDSKAGASDRKCSSCEKADEWLPCIKCRGSCINLKKRAACETAPYIVYMAAFGEKVKVGVSNYFRFYERILEQGADFSVRLLEVKDGGHARHLEQKISKATGITDRVRSAFKLRNFISDPNQSAAALSRNIVKIIESGFPVGENTPIYDMRRFYRIFNAKQPFKEADYSNKISGSVACVKGSIAILKNSEGLLQVNFRELVGCDVFIKAKREIPEDYSLKMFS